MQRSSSSTWLAAFTWTRRESTQQQTTLHYSKRPRISECVSVRACPCCSVYTPSMNNYSLLCTMQQICFWYFPLFNPAYWFTGLYNHKELVKKQSIPSLLATYPVSLLAPYPASQLLIQPPSYLLIQTPTYLFALVKTDRHTEIPGIIREIRYCVHGSLKALCPLGGRSATTHQ